MQTELFKKNAIILMYDDVQQMLYKDILFANGFIVKDADSVENVIESLNRDTNLLLVDLDSLDNSSLKLMSDKISTFPSHITFVGLTINSKPIDIDNIKIIQLPIFIDRFLDEITKIDEPQEKAICESIA